LRERKEMRKFDPPRMDQPGERFEDYFKRLAEYIIEYFRELIEELQKEVETK